MPEYNYPYTYKIMYARSELRKAIEKLKILSKEKILEEFYGVRQATNEEINEYFNKKSFKYHNTEFFGYFYCFISICLLFFYFFLLKFIVETNNFFVIIFSPFFFGAGIISSFCIGYDKIKWSDSNARKGKIYVADCYEYDFKGIGTIRHRSFYIKIHDNKGKYIDEWIRVAHKPRPQSRIILYIFEYKNEIGLDVIFK